MSIRRGTVYNIGLSTRDEKGVHRLDLLVMETELARAIGKALEAVPGGKLVEARTTVFDGVVE
jgi:hypothetical protein